MVVQLRDLPIGSFFRKYMGHKEEVERAIYHYSRYDHIRDCCVCVKYYECGIIEPCYLWPCHEVYRI